ERRLSRRAKTARDVVRTPGRTSRPNAVARKIAAAVPTLLHREFGTEAGPASRRHPDQDATRPAANDSARYRAATCVSAQREAKIFRSVCVIRPQTQCLIKFRDGLRGLSQLHVNDAETVMDRRFRIEPSRFQVMPFRTFKIAFQKQSAAEVVMR